LYVGRLVEIKNVKTTICAFSRLNQKENVLVVVGDGPEMTSLKQMAQNSEANVIFTGRLEGDDLYQWYNIANYFVLASYLEPFGAVTNEALLAGCWCLISNKAGSQCLIEDGKNGYTFYPTDIDDLANKMLLSLKKVNCTNINILKDNGMIFDYDKCIQILIRKLHNI
jgi:glycosyltransferase involved in cell wall biosynthesis